LLYFINLSREDQYLAFLNVEGQLFTDSIYKDPTDIPQPNELQQLQAKIMQKHSMLLFQFCTLLSAYLLAHHVEKLLQDTTFETSEARFEKMKSDCLALYVVRYDHIIATYKDDEDQNQEEEDEQNESPEGTEENGILEEAEKNQPPKENEQSNEETKQQDEETEQQEERLEKQGKGCAKWTDVNEIPKEELQEGGFESSSNEEPAAKKLKTDH